MVAIKRKQETQEKDQKEDSFPLLQLVPFFIEYSGPAKFERYFHMRPFKKTSGESKKPVHAATTEDEKEEKKNREYDDDGSYEATFRGRIMHSFSVKVPNGYRGLITKTNSVRHKRKFSYSSDHSHSADDGFGVGNSVSRRKSRRTHSQIVDNNQDNMTETGSQDHESFEMINFSDIGKEHNEQAYNNGNDKKRSSRISFQNFLIWTPDEPGDANDDTYARAVDEWLLLAQLVHGPIKDY